MREHLPPIDFAVSCRPAIVIEDMSDIAETFGRFTVERHRNVMGKKGFNIVNLRYKGQSPHVALGARLICRSDLSNRVAVEIRAQRWKPDPPTRDAYCTAAKNLLGPILRAYNAAHRTRHRLRIPSSKSIEPKLSDASAKYFNRFVGCANKSSLHPLDWMRFYEFVWKSRSHLLYEEDMTRLLVKSRFSASYAEHIASIYIHLCEFKGLR